MYLWRAVDEDGDELDILVQSRRNRRAATRFLRKVLKGQGREPRRMVTDKQRSCPAACRTVMPSVVHVTDQYANNRAEVSHQPTRQRECQMRHFKSAALPVSGTVICSILSAMGPVQGRCCLAVGASGSLGTMMVPALKSAAARIVRWSRGLGQSTCWTTRRHPSVPNWPVKAVVWIQRLICLGDATPTGKVSRSPASKGLS